MEPKDLRGSVGGFSGVVLFGAVLVGAVAGQTTERVSVSSLGAQGNGPSGNTHPPSISADGRYMAFESGASNLVSGNTNVFDIFVYDHQTGTTELVSVDSLGAEANDDCFAPMVSADGRYVAFDTYATNLVSGDTNLLGDVFVHDRLTGTTERVSVDSVGAQANGDSSSHVLAISADGRCVAFDSRASNLVSGDTNGVMDVFVHDRQTDTTERVNVDSLGNQGNEDSQDPPAISADGRYVAFDSFASNLVSGDKDNSWDVFVHDRQTGSTERVSVDSLGNQGHHRHGSSSHQPAICADGRYVVFDSDADNFGSGDTNGDVDVFVHDRQAGSTERVSVDSLGNQGNGDSLFPAISGDGRYVVFNSLASNLVSGDTNSRYDVFLRDRCAPANSATFPGDGINADVIAPVNAVLGSSWSAPLTIGHPHGTGGIVSLKIRSTTINGQNFPSPLGGRPTEILIAGPLLASIYGSHDGVTGGIAPQLIPDDLSLVGATWAAQYTVYGGGFADYSQAVFGVVGCQ